MKGKKGRRVREEMREDVKGRMRGKGGGRDNGRMKERSMRGEGRMQYERGKEEEKKERE